MVSVSIIPSDQSSNLVRYDDRVISSDLPTHPLSLSFYSTLSFQRIKKCMSKVSVSYWTTMRLDVVLSSTESVLLYLGFLRRKHSPHK